MTDDLTDSDAQADVSFSRSTGPLSSLGKRTEEVRGLVPAVIKDELAARLRELDMTESAYVCEVLIKELRGAAFLRSLYIARANAIAATPQESTLPLGDTGQGAR